ncbi:DUF6207 family protein [Streptomyces sp. R11]|uniref:DUF6207 family protein n=1 Tax=Streptomyces sp. R11 TaxID=3238625 RepID=A0AB39NB14_9ACTN
MNPLNETPVSRPSLVVVDLAAADDANALAFQQLFRPLLDTTWAFSGPAARRTPTGLDSELRPDE